MIREGGVRLDQREDVFDRIIRLRVFGFVRPFYVAHKEVLLYLFFGGLTTLISIVSFAAFYDKFGFNEHLANVSSWVLAVAFAFWTNRTWVFKGTTGGDGVSFLKEITGFYGGRVLTLIVEEIIVFAFISLMRLPALYVKLSGQVVVLVLNYLVSKFWVFRK